MQEDKIAHLRDMWHQSGVEPGDVLLVHSSLRRTLKTYGVTPEEVLESFLQAVGPEGTLLLPLFNFEFTKGKPFDIRHTPSHMGILTEVGRRHPEAVRSKHPIYSFAAIGKQAHLFDVDNFSGYGADSPFGILHRLGGKIAVLDLLDQESMTFYHYIEEMHNVPYRYHKTFTGCYTDWDGTTQVKTYGLFVRDLDKGVETYVHPMGEILWAEGYYRGSRPWVGTGLRTIRAQELYDRVSEVIRSGQAKGILYRIRKQSD